VIPKNSPENIFHDPPVDFNTISVYIRIKSAMKRINIYIPEELWKQLEKIEEKKGVKPSESIRRAVKEYLKRHK
jgi:hypothetical protein